MVTLYDSLEDFQSASAAVLSFLHGRLGFDLWMVTRVEGSDWIVLQAADHGYGVEPDTVFRWTDSFCSRMVAGFGPRIAARSDSVAAYAEAPIGQQVKIGAYVGVPLNLANGTLFGTLCAIHPTPHPEEITKELPLVELLAALLSSILNSELQVLEAARRAERAETEANTDALTGLYNRRGWDLLLDAEEARCRRYGHPACVVVVDLDGLKEVNDIQGHHVGDELIRRAATAIREATRASDVVARVGGDEFAVLGVECNSARSVRLSERIREALDKVNVKASLGMARRIPARGLRHGWREADEAMYCEKERKPTRPKRLTEAVTILMDRNRQALPVAE